MLQSEETYKEKYDTVKKREIGRGKFSIVYEIFERGSTKKFAAKHIKTRRKEELAMAKDEMAILSELSHQHILSLIDAFQISSKREICLLTEYLDGGELFEKVISPDFNLTERECVLFMRQICEAVVYMHSKNIIHLDLKPENVVVCTKESDQVKIVDFGLARHIPDGESMLNHLCGTPEFISPEVLNFNPISLKSDIWSIGVIAYVLLSGLSPFLGDSDAQTWENVTRAEPITFEDEEEFDEISENGKNFITSTVVKKKEHRLSAPECVHHPWLTSLDGLDSSKLIKKENLKKFVARRRWQKFGNMVSAINRMSRTTRSHSRSSVDSFEAEDCLHDSAQFLYGEKYVTTTELILQ